MKITKSAALLFCISLLMSCSEQKELSPLGVFPLEKSTVKAALVELY